MIFEKTLEKAVVAPAPRWPSSPRLSAGDKAAIDTWCREAEQTIRALTAAVLELQKKVNELDERS